MRAGAIGAGDVVWLASNTTGGESYRGPEDTPGPKDSAERRRYYRLTAAGLKVVRGGGGIARPDTPNRPGKTHIARGRCLRNSSPPFCYGSIRTISRRAYGDEALRLVLDRAGDEKGFLCGLRLWLDLLVDLAISLPREYIKAPATRILVAHAVNSGPSFQLFDGTIDALPFAVCCQRADEAVSF